MSDVEREFDEAMMNVYSTAKEKCNYNAKLFRSMLLEHGGIETALRLLNDHQPQLGFRRLWECGCLELTMECLVLSPSFKGLFEDHELETARQRLRQHDYDPEKCEQTSP